MQAAAAPKSKTSQGCATTATILRGVQELRELVLGGGREEAGRRREEAGMDGDLGVRRKFGCKGAEATSYQRVSQLTCQEQHSAGRRSYLLRHDFGISYVFRKGLLGPKLHNPKPKACRSPCNSQAGGEKRSPCFSSSPSAL